MKILLLCLLSFSCFSQMIITEKDVYEKIPERPVNLEENKEIIIVIPANTDYQGIFFKVPDRNCENCYIRAVYERPADVIEDFNDTENVYTGSWGTASNQTYSQNFLNKDFHYSYEVGATVKLSFTGTKIEWYAEKRNNHAIVGIVIDSQPEVMVDLYANTTANSSEKVFEKVLTPGNHTITVRLTNQKNPAATEVSIVHDYFRITK